MIYMKEKRQVFEDDYTSTEMLVILMYVCECIRKKNINKLCWNDSREKQSMNRWMHSVY